MKAHDTMRHFLLAVVAWCAFGASASASDPAAGYQYLFSGFTDSGPSTESLNLSYSHDGVNWTSGGNVYSAPSGNGVRDPSIMRLNGVYYVAYTAGTFGGASYFQICRSTDLVHWTYLCNVDATCPNGGYYTWAPEWFIDRDGTVYLFLAREQTDNTWRIYWTRATTLDLTAWTSVQPVGGDMTGRGAIDAQVVRDGTTYYLFYRNYGAGGGTDCIEMARGSSPTAFSLYKTGDWLGIGSPREGVSAVHTGGSNWRVYYNNLSVYGDPNYYVDSTDGLATWSTPAATNLINDHGTVLPLTTAATAPFDLFLFNYGLGGVDPGVDFDHDGIPDLTEFLLGSNPATPDDAVLPVASNATSGGITSLKYTFRTVANPGSVTWTVETSTDLVHWTAANPGTNGVTLTTTPYDAASNQNVMTIPGPAGGRVFARLRTTLPAASSAAAAVSGKR